MTKTNTMRVLLLSTSAAALAGCSPAGVFDQISTGSIFIKPKQAAFHHTLAEQRPVQEAMAELPFEAGKVVEVVQSRYANGIRQKMVFQGDLETRGTNNLTLAMRVPQQSGRKDAAKISIAKPSRSVIAAEMRKVLPGMAMRWSNTLHTNAYGPYGYALGRASGNVRCIYGWQHLEGTKQDKYALWRKDSGKPQLSVRLRVCRANVSSERLVDLMQNLRINADPETVRVTASTTWSAGEGGAALGVGSSSTGNGYVSDQRVAAEPVQQAQPKVRRAKRVAKRRVVKKRVVKASAPKPVTSAAAVYSPPVPTPDDVAQGTLAKSSGTVLAPENTTTTALPLPPIVAGGTGGGLSSGAKVAVSQTSKSAPKPVAPSYKAPVAVETTAMAKPVVPLPAR
ncbi:MAG: cellulose biosynthesis protein BcsN [Pseudomonadota bacterium]